MDTQLSDPTNLLRFVVVDRIPFSLLVLVGAMVLMRVVTRTANALGERFTERRLRIKQVSTILRFTILFLTTLMIVSSVFQLTNELILAVGGTVAVAMGFAFKDLLASLVAGIILLFDRPFQVGDRVSFGAFYGEVIEIGLRAVRLVTLDDNLVSIPNNRFLSEAVSCANSGALDQMCVFDFFIGCNEDFDLAKRLLYEATATSRYVYLNKPIAIVVREEPVAGQGHRFAIRLSVKAYVLDGRYETAMGTDITERAKRAFQHAGIRTAGEMEWGRPGGALERNISAAGNDPDPRTRPPPAPAS